MERHDDVGSDIAVIGMACRFPGAPNLERFWQNLRNGRDSVTFFDDEELLRAGTARELLGDARYVKAGQVLPDIDQFDAELFQITRDEAEMLDPQQRLFLECAVEAFEHAGYAPESFPGPIGVFAGVGLNTYLICNLAARYRSGSSVDRYRLMVANDKDYLATRVSYKLDLRGPSVNINTACSTSLVAVHFASSSLLGGECDMALVGCAHVKVPQVEGYLFQEGLIFSPDGRCRAFDANAQGTTIGSGVGIVLLKRLADALAARDRIHAVIKGTAINNDGHAKVSYTAPSVEGQAAAIREAQAIAGCDPRTISYVEAHGTGTPLGDPIEIAALARAFSEESDEGVPRHDRCAIGSVKSNIGHLDVAAGMAGLIKTCLMLDHQWLTPSLHFETPNPAIDLANTPFYVNTASTAWPANGLPRRAGVSSFGIGGTNAHVVLEEAPARAASRSTSADHLLLVSARSVKALEKAGDDLARHLREHRDLDLGDVAYTLAMRKAYPHRLALVVNDHRDAALTLTLGDRERVTSGHATEPTAEIGFIFPDTVNADAVASLGEALPAFRAALDDVRAEMPAATPPDISARHALVRLWESWNVRPSAGTAPAHEQEGWILVRLAFTLPAVLHELGRLWTVGTPIDWASVYAGSEYGRIPLPARRFERKSYWLDALPTASPADHAGVRATNGAGALRRQLDSLDGTSRTDVLITFVQQDIARILGTRELPNANANLFELGIDSLILIEVAARLSEELERSVAPSLFVDYFSIRAFAAHLIGESADRTPMKTAQAAHGGQ